MSTQVNVNIYSHITAKEIVGMEHNNIYITWRRPNHNLIFIFYLFGYKELTLCTRFHDSSANLNKGIHCFIRS